MNRFQKLQLLSKQASKLGFKKGKGLNYLFSGIFSDKDLQALKEIALPEQLLKKTTKAEKAFLEVGAYLSKSINQLEEISDYLLSQKIEAGYIEKNYDIDFESIENLKTVFEKLNSAQREWHQEAAAKQKAGAGDDRYLTNKVVHDFDDGWKVVYVPGIEDGPNHKGNPKRSNDRIVEGNKLGLCMGSTMGLYQNNRSGKIYSVRDPSNEPKVTIRIHNGKLLEAKGKNNLSPSVVGAFHAVKWLEIQDNLRYKTNGDYLSFPPLTAEKAKEKFETDPVSPYNDGWAMHWYKKGISELDADVKNKIQKNDIKIINSGMGKKYKELVEPVVEYWAKKAAEENDFSLFGIYNGGDLKYESNYVSYDIKHESWRLYKDNPFVKRAVAALARSEAYSNRLLDYEIYRYHPEESKILAENILKSNIFDFFAYRLYEIYTDLGATKIEKYIHALPKEYFEKNLEKYYPAWRKKAVKRLAIVEPFSFFELNLEKEAPETGKLVAQTILRDDFKLFFTRTDLYEKYPEIAKYAVMVKARYEPSLIFELALEKRYPDVGEVAAKALLRNAPHAFIMQKVYLTYPEIGKSFAEELIQEQPDRYFQLGFHRAYPEIGKAKAQECVNANYLDYFKYRLDNVYPELEEIAAKRYAEDRPTQFLTNNELPGKYPDLERLAYDILDKQRQERMRQNRQSDVLDIMEDPLFLKEYSKLRRLSDWLIKNGFREAALTIHSIRRK